MADKIITDAVTTMETAYGGTNIELLTDLYEKDGRNGVDITVDNHRVFMTYNMAVEMSGPWGKHTAEEFVFNVLKDYV